MDSQKEKQTAAQENKSALAEYIDFALDVVDSEDWPSSWGPDRSVDSACNREFGGLRQLVDNAFGGAPAREKLGFIVDGMVDEQSRFCLRATSDKRFAIRDEIETGVGQYVNEYEILPLTVGIAFGLRVAGMSQVEARAVLRAYLRNYGEPAPERNEQSQNL